MRFLGCMAVAAGVLMFVLAMNMAGPMDPFETASPAARLWDLAAALLTFAGIGLVAVFSAVRS